MRGILDFGNITLNGKDFNIGLLLFIIAFLVVSLLICIRISKRNHLYEGQQHINEITEES